MKHLWKAMLVLPAAVVLAAVLGCPPGKTESTGGGNGDTGPGGGTTTKAEDVVVGKARGTITGKVTYTGDPKVEDLAKAHAAAIEAGKDPSHCTKDKTLYKLKVNPETKAVENAVVYLRPARGKHIILEADEAKKLAGAEKPTVDQPECAFKPHVSLMFPDFWNPKSKKLEPTGQTLLIKNSAPISHNTKLERSGTRIDDQTIPAGKDLPVSTITSDYGAPVTLSCTIHGYMTGYVWAFEHPFAAITKADGTFEIKDVPADVDLFIVAWHELGNKGQEPGFINDKKVNGDPIKVKDGETKKDVNFTLKFP